MSQHGTREDEVCHLPHRRAAPEARPLPPELLAADQFRGRDSWVAKAEPMQLEWIAPDSWPHRWPWLKSKIGGRQNQTKRHECGKGICNEEAGK